LTIAVLAFVPRQSGSYLWMSFFHLSNVAPLVGVPMTYAMFWSLAVEEHFYLVWPFVARHLPPRRLLACAATIAIASPILRWHAFDWAPGGGYYTWLVADGLALGAVVALFVRLTHQQRRPLVIFSSITAGIALWMLVAGTPFGILTRQRPLG